MTDFVILQGVNDRIFCTVTMKFYTQERNIQLKKTSVTCAHQIFWYDKKVVYTTHDFFFYFG